MKSLQRFSAWLLAASLSGLGSLYAEESTSKELAPEIVQTADVLNEKLSEPIKEESVARNPIKLGELKPDLTIRFANLNKIKECTGFFNTFRLDPGLINIFAAALYSGIGDNFDLFTPNSEIVTHACFVHDEVYLIGTFHLAENKVKRKTFLDLLRQSFTVFEKEGRQEVVVFAKIQPEFGLIELENVGFDDKDVWKAVDEKDGPFAVKKAVDGCSKNPVYIKFRKFTQCHI